MKAVAAFLLALLLPTSLLAQPEAESHLYESTNIDVLRADTTQYRLSAFWTDHKAKPFGTIAKTTAYVRKKQKLDIHFATNAGPVSTDFVPQGLLVQNGEMLVTANTTQTGPLVNGQPNPLQSLYIVDNQGIHIQTNEDFVYRSDIQTGFQAGPMLVTDSIATPELAPLNDDLQIRTALGIDAAGKLVMIYTREPMGIYQFATFIKEELRCHTAMQLDSYTCKVYAPQWERVAEDGNFSTVLVLHNQ